MQKYLVLLIYFLFFSCKDHQPSKTFKVFNEVDSLKITNIIQYNHQSLSYLPNKVLAIDSNIRNKQVLGWRIESYSSMPTEICILSRGLIDFDVTFYVLDANKNLLETKRIYWGMPANIREENSYLPIKWTFIDSHQRLEILVVIEKSLRQNAKFSFEINTSKVETDFFWMKVIDSILTAFLIVNIGFSGWLFKNDRRIGNILKFYFCYNLFILLFFFFRYFLSYLNDFDLPMVINYSVNIFSHLAYFCYYYFGLYFIDKNYKPTKIEKILIVVSFLTFLYPSISFLQITLTIRIIIVLIFLANLYRNVFLHRTKKQTKIFFLISLPLFLFGGMNAIYGVMSNDFNLKYSLELSKISILVESIMLFGGLISRNRTIQN